MRYTGSMLTSEHHTISKTIRIPKCLLDKAVEEATRKGVGKPAVFLRMLVLQRIRTPKDTYENLSQIAHIRKPELRGSPSDRVNLRFSEESFKEVLDASQFVASGNITSLVIAVLLEHYEATASSD